MSKRKRYRADGQYSGNHKVEKKEVKAAAKSSKLESKATLALAKAQKRKWLAILLGVCIAGYLIISTGAGGAWLDKMKGLIP